MKRLLTAILILGGCCAKQADEPPPVPRIILYFDYHHNGFSEKDTLFHFSGYDNNGGNSFLYIKEPEPVNDSIKAIYLYTANYGKLLIESPASGFRDSLTDVGYESKRIKKGNARCAYFIYTDYNVHATHKGQNLSSGENSTLEVNVTK